MLIGLYVEANSDFWMTLPLLPSIIPVMSWFGKVIGGAMGWMVGGPLGLILGASLGHNFDKGLRSNLGSPNLLERKQIAFFTATFSVMGHICKADGKVSESEIQTAQRIMDSMSLNEKMKELAVNLFDHGKEAGFNLDSAVLDLRSELGTQPTLYRAFLEIQIMAAKADGHLHDNELAILRRICALLQFPEFEFERMCKGFGGGRSGASGKALSSTRAREILEVDENADQAEIKRAYRRQMNRHHPDKLASKGMPEEMVKVATDRAVEIRAAYDLLKTA
ncbi:MAG: co-chaperone DjlA [Candidatus Eutrophobiaceae bacterium]